MKIDMTLFFSAEGDPISIKFRRLVQNDMSTAVIWSKSKPDIEFQYGGVWANSMVCHARATCHVAGEFYVMILELRVTLNGAATGRIQWHVIPGPRVTLQGAATC